MHTVPTYIRQKRIFAVQISGKYILPKSALVDFLADEFTFEIVHKSTWHINTILLFVDKEQSKTQPAILSEINQGSPTHPHVPKAAVLAKRLHAPKARLIKIHTIGACIYL